MSPREAAGVAGGAPDVIGLLAGAGGLPIAVARAARARGIRVVAAAFRDLTDPELEREVDRLSWHALGTVTKLLDEWRGEAVRDAVMAGKVPKTLLVRDSRALELDATAQAALARLSDRKDDTILQAAAGLLGANGITLRGQAELVPELLASEGVLGAALPTTAQLAEVRFAWPIAKTLAGMDAGQSVVVSGGAVVALEAIEGTDAAIRRGAALAEAGVCVVKVAKPDQDPRFDLPAVGPATLRVMVEVGASLLAVEAGRTLVLDAAAVRELADRHGIALLGIPAEGPSR